jgi:hypothetical protein
MLLNRRFLETKTGKAIYVGTVTVVLFAIGSWAVLAHQDDPMITRKTLAAPWHRVPAARLWAIRILPKRRPKAEWPK